MHTNAHTRGIMCAHCNTHVRHTDYKKALDMHCSAAYASMEASVFSTYEDTNKAIEEKIQDFVSTLERIGIYIV